MRGMYEAYSFKQALQVDVHTPPRMLVVNTSILAR